MKRGAAAILVVHLYTLTTPAGAPVIGNTGLEVTRNNVQIINEAGLPLSCPDVHCLRLNGNTAGEIQSVMTFAPGDYNLNFRLNGSGQRLVGGVVTNNPDTTVAVSFGDFSHTYALAFNTTETVNVPVMVTPADDRLIFNSIGTNLPIAAGPVLLSVRVSAPEPATLGLMALGLLGGVGFAGRKRRT